MMRNTVDYENLSGLSDEYSRSYFKKKCDATVCCVILTMTTMWSLGFGTGYIWHDYNHSDYDGSYYE